jgi:hypothetical protein
MEKTAPTNKTPTNAKQTKTQAKNNLGNPPAAMTTHLTR